MQKWKIWFNSSNMLVCKIKWVSIYSRKKSGNFIYNIMKIQIEILVDTLLTLLLHTYEFFLLQHCWVNNNWSIRGCIRLCTCFNHVQRLPEQVHRVLQVLAWLLLLYSRRKSVLIFLRHAPSFAPSLWTC